MGAECTSHLICVLVDHPRVPCCLSTPMARSSLCCPEEARLRQEQGAHPPWEGGFSDPLRASHLTQPQLQASGDTFWDAYSYSEKQQHGNSKDEITEAVCHQKCKDRHLSTIVNRITGECSLTGSFLPCSWKPLETSACQKASSCRDAVSLC